MLFAPIFFGTSNISYSLPSPLYIGDDYITGLGNDFVFDFIPPVGAILTNCTTLFTGYNLGDPTVSWSVSGTITDNGNGTWKARFQLPNTVTTTLTYGYYSWSVMFTNISDTSTLFSDTNMLWQPHTIPTISC